MIKEAKQKSDIVIVSIFVNPLQFGLNEDLDRYPQTLKSDLALIENLAHALFMPDVKEIYKNLNSQIKVCAGEVGNIFEGECRPGHFDRVLKIVAKLFNIVQPDIAFFGQKDAQQINYKNNLLFVFEINLIIFELNHIFLLFQKNNNFVCNNL